MHCAVQPQSHVSKAVDTWLIAQYLPKAYVMQAPYWIQYAYDCTDPIVKQRMST